MQIAATHTETPVAIRTNLGAIIVSLELSRSKWLVFGCRNRPSHSEWP
jgi:transposase